MPPDYFTKVLGAPFDVPFDDSYFPIPPIPWGSWSSYHEDVTEQDMVRNTDWIAKNLKPHGLDYILLDDGYDRVEKEEHDSIGKWDPAKFPHGPRWLAEYIKSKGLHAGLWIVPSA
jgi:alpha-galactosidase